MGRDTMLKLIAAAACTAPGTLALAALQDDHGVQVHEADGDLHAHGGEAVGAIPTIQQGLATGITALVVFAIVFAILAAKVWPAITKALDERAQKIEEEIAAAQRAREQAAAALESYQESLAQARAEAQKMLEDARGQQQKLAADLKAKAETELNDMRDKARRDIEAAKRAAIGEIYTDATNMAAEIAGKILSREVNADDHRRLVDESLAELQTAAR